MNDRWRWALLALWALQAGAARAGADHDHEPDDGVPDALDDDRPLHLEESRNVRPRAYQQAPATAGGAGPYGVLPSGFRPAASLAELAGYQPRAPPQLFADVQQPLPPPRQLQRKPQSQPARQQLQRLQAQAQADAEAEAEAEADEERPEPDRLAQLLQQSKFECGGKQSGYYADQELACEVFHYCQDTVKHSWICPDGFTFHQVHLICMPPTQDNICQKSAKYHFVNEYLYRPVNEEEVQRRPNVSLRYSDRYYPQEVFHDDRYDDDEEEEEPAQRAAPARLTARPEAVGARPQVFRSAEEVNIPLGQRRPQRPYEFDF